MAPVTEVLEARGADKARLVTIDGVPWRVLPLAVVREIGLGSGDDVDLPQLEARVCVAEMRLARARAFALAGYRERCSAEVLTRLTGEGYLHAIADAVVADLAATGAIDDARCAEVLARTLIRVKSYGRARALRDMVSRGLDQDLALAAIEACAPLDDEAQRSRALARRMVRDRDTVERLAQRLLRRGFSAALSLQAARECIAGRPANRDDPHGSLPGVTDDDLEASGTWWGSE